MWDPLHDDQKFITVMGRFYYGHKLRITKSLKNSPYEKSSDYCKSNYFTTLNIPPQRV